MAYVKPEYRIAKVHMAAGLFVGFTRDAKIIAEKLNTTERNVLTMGKDTRMANRTGGCRLRRRPVFSSQ